MKTPKPWNSIPESIVTTSSDPRNFVSSLESPCLSCSHSPCCTHLPLNSFQIKTAIDLDHAIYLLNFQNIELGLSSTGDWSAYYKHPCRYLDLSNYHCTIHNQEHQPNICKNYNPYNCWYKKVFTCSKSSSFIRVDKTRMKYILERIQFDQNGELVKVPKWDSLNEELEHVFDEPHAFESYSDFPNDPYREWKDGAKKDMAYELEVVSIDELENPCSSCAAYCCTSLIFPQLTPASYSGLDYFKFCLGFPGVELGISDQGWAVIIRTKCMHLKDQKCSLFGLPERPFICKYYDEWKCEYKHQFGHARTEGFMRVRLEEFECIVPIT